MGADHGGEGNSRAVPKAVRHKRILDIAEEQPDASLTDIAAEVPSATEDLVENILEEYGDPAEDESSVEEPSDGGYGSVELNEKQLETLRAIHDNPEMTQGELGEVLGVSNATICNRVNSIEGFEWDSRQEFASNVLDTEAEAEETMTSNGSDQKQTARELSEKVKSLEQRLEEYDDERRGVAIGSPELTHKVMHACLESEKVSEDEELEILKYLLG